VEKDHGAFFALEKPSQQYLFNGLPEYLLWALMFLKIYADTVMCSIVGEGAAGYSGEDPLKVKAPGSMVHAQDDAIKYVRTKVRCRHETADKAIKEFKVIGSRAFQQDQEFELL